MSEVLTSRSRIQGEAKAEEERNLNLQEEVTTQKFVYKFFISNDGNGAVSKKKALTSTLILKPISVKVTTMKKTLTLISLGLLALTGNAFADSDNYTSFSGTGCDNYYYYDSGQFNHQYDGITNISSSARWVSCPVNKDNVSGLGGQHTWVRWSGSGTLTCYINNFNINGERTEYKLASGGPGWISLPNLGSDDSWGTYTLYCLLPAGATLQTYHVLEF